MQLSNLRYYLMIVTLILFLSALACSVWADLTPEDHFFGIPGVDTLSKPWVLEVNHSSFLRRHVSSHAPFLSSLTQLS